MNYKLTILGSVVVVGIGIAVWQWLSPVGLSEPVALVEIPAGEFMMGSPATEADREGNEARHPVKITYAFQINGTNTISAFTYHKQRLLFPIATQPWEERQWAGTRP